MSDTLGKIDNFASRRKMTAVECPELGGVQHLKALGVRDLMQIDRMPNPDSVPASVRELFFAMVDPEGNRIYTTPEDLVNLAEMSFETANRLYQALQDINGTSKAAIEAVEKKSEPSPSSDSASDSQAT